jgi:hypothetical protein
MASPGLAHGSSWAATAAPPARALTGPPTELAPQIPGQGNQGGCRARYVRSPLLPHDHSCDEVHDPADSQSEELDADEREAVGPQQQALLVLRSKLDPTVRRVTRHPHGATVGMEPRPMRTPRPGPDAVAPPTCVQFDPSSCR